MSMEKFGQPPRQEKPPEPQPEHIEDGPKQIQHKLGELILEKKKESAALFHMESGIFAKDPAKKAEEFEEIARLSKELAQQDDVFKQLLVDAFARNLDQDSGLLEGESSHESKHWMENIFVEAYTEYTGEF